MNPINDKNVFPTSAIPQISQRKKVEAILFKPPMQPFPAPFLGKRNVAVLNQNASVKRPRQTLNVGNALTENVVRSSQSAVLVEKIATEQKVFDIDVNRFVDNQALFDENILKQCVIENIPLMPGTKVLLMRLMNYERFDDLVKVKILLHVLEQMNPQNTPKAGLGNFSLLCKFVPRNLVVEAIHASHWSISYHDSHPSASHVFVLPHSPFSAISSQFSGSNRNYQVISFYFFGKLIEEYFPNKNSRRPEIDGLIDELTNIPQDENTTTCSLLYVNRQDLKTYLLKLRHKLICSSNNVIRLRFS